MLANFMAVCNKKKKCFSLLGEFVIIQLLAKTIEDIPPKYLFLMILLPFLISAKKKMFFRLIEL